MKSSASSIQAVAFVLVISVLLLTLLPHPAAALPEGPTITYISNETNSPTAATMINTTGGSITTVVLNGTTQNVRWKAYVGNVTGKLALQDAAGYSIYDWAASTPKGEIYATRKDTTVSWGNIKCANLTNIENENHALNQTSAEDNITTTFSTKLHSSFYAGTNFISSNSCYSVHTFVNNSEQSNLFQEVLLYDGTTSANGDIVYASIMEQHALGYNNEPYDFQIILPENGQEGWSSSTAYYFYVELS